MLVARPADAVAGRSSPASRGALRTYATALSLAAALVACGDDSVDSDAERFCGEATSRTELIIAPPLATEAEAQESLEFYRLMGELAPVAISEQWNDLVVAMETAITVVPGDAASQQLAAATAFATERSAYEVAVWLQRNCGVTIPITTIAPQAPLPPPTTAPPTVPGASTPAPTTAA